VITFSDSPLSFFWLFFFPLLPCIFFSLFSLLRRNSFPSRISFVGVVQSGLKRLSSLTLPPPLPREPNQSSIFPAMPKIPDNRANALQPLHLHELFSNPLAFFPFPVLAPFAPFLVVSAGSAANRSCSINDLSPQFLPFWQTSLPYFLQSTSVRRVQWIRASVPNWHPPSKQFSFSSRVPCSFFFPPFFPDPLSPPHLLVRMSDDLDVVLSQLFNTTDSSPDIPSFLFGFFPRPLLSPAFSVSCFRPRFCFLLRFRKLPFLFPATDPPRQSVPFFHPRPSLPLFNSEVISLFYPRPASISCIGVLSSRLMTNFLPN